MSYFYEYIGPLILPLCKIGTNLGYSGGTLKGDPTDHQHVTSNFHTSGHRF